jgi:hypothetical protein
VPPLRPLRWRDVIRALPPTPPWGAIARDYGSEASGGVGRWCVVRWPGELGETVGSNTEGRMPRSSNPPLGRVGAYRCAGRLL